MVNLVLLDDGSIWSCDVGFGGDGPTSPLRLRSSGSGAEQLEEPEPEVVSNLGAQDVRLRRGVFPGTVRGDANRVWFYEYRNGGGGGVGGSGQEGAAAEKQWNTYYAFGEAEASQWDLECANWWVAGHPESFQRRQVLAVKFLRDDEAQPQPPSPGGQETGDVVVVSVVGKMMLADGVLKRNMGGRTEVVKVCRSEEERVEVLREVFGIVLTEEERLGIRGFETELRQ